jgi:hypothetical protein
LQGQAVRKRATEVIEVSRWHLDHEVGVARRPWNPVKVRCQGADNHVRHPGGLERVEHRDNRDVRRSPALDGPEPGQTNREERTNARLIELGMLMPNAVGHHAAHPLEEPRSLEELVLRPHGTSPCDFFPIQLVGQRDNRRHRGGF